MGFDNLMMKMDQTVTHIFGQWDIYSTAIFVVVFSTFVWSVVTSRDPDAHPMLLARQAQPSPVRQEGESAVFRSHSAPHGIPLNSGLQIKDPGDSKWSRGRDGNLSDIWRRAVAGSLDREGKDTGEVGKLFTVLGSEKIIEHDLADVTKQINLIGQHLKQNGGQNIAIYLPNSVEFLASLFACAFYDLTTILIPYDKSVEDIISFLKESKADTLIAPVGQFPYEAITTDYPAIRQLVWVVDEGSRHMDWNEVPAGTGGDVNVSTWSDIVESSTPSRKELPVVNKAIQPKGVLAFWPSGKLVEYTQANLIAGIAGQLTSVPTTQRITHSDLFLPADSLSTIYPLILTLAALFSNASVALNSVAGPETELGLATQGVAPTIIVSSAPALNQAHLQTTAKLNSTIYNIVHWFQTRSLVQDGVMPLSSMFSRMYDSFRPAIGTTPGKLRLIYVAEQTGAGSIPLKSETLSDLRIFTSARIIYALTAASVAGAVTQTGIYDYRVNDSTEKYSHFGAPVTSVEIFFKDTKEHRTTDIESAGELLARGPAVVGGEASLGITGKIKEDLTLALL